MILIQQIGVIILILPYISGIEEQHTHAGCSLQSQAHITKSCLPVPCHSRSAISLNTCALVTPSKELQ